MNYTGIFFNSIAHLLYPDVCAGCGSDLVNAKQLICISCAATLPVTNFHKHSGNPVEKMFWGRLPLVTATSYAYFAKHSAMQNLLHQLKYGGNKEIGYYFGRRMGELFRESDRYDDIDALIPLPLFFKREKKRGYNQAEVICEGIAEIMNLPILKDVVARKKNTQTQTRKSRTERWENIAGRFELINDKPAEGKHILLVDDVLTTGATMEACGSALIKANKIRLSIATMAYASV